MLRTKRAQVLRRINVTATKSAKTPPYRQVAPAAAMMMKATVRTRGIVIASTRNYRRVGLTTVAAAAAGVSPGKKHGDLPKNFEHTDVEEPLYKRWEQSGAFKPKPNDEKEPFTIPMPPPNVTGALHMGHAMFVTIQDVMSRSMRMRGHPTLWLPGTDHAGIATQLVVERQLESEGLSRIGVGREEFEKRTWKWKKEYGDRIQNQIKRLGASCDWSRERFTLDDNLSEGVLEAFSRLHEQKLIYRGSYMVNWAPKLQTAVSDLEVEYSDEPGFLFHFKYPLEGYEEDNTKFLPVATTRPETIVGDTAVAVHPEDPRYKDFVGKFCVVPGTNGRKIPVIADDYVDMEFGTGALKITPAHDPNDYDMGKKRDLEFINIMNKDGTMSANAQAYAGLDRAECRVKIWEDLEKDGLAIKKEDYETRVPRSQRGGEVIEPMVSEQWFCKMETMSTPALNALKTGELTIVPKRFEKVYETWLSDCKDWCISRQLWWGHRIPVWYVHDSIEDLQNAKKGEGKGASKKYVVAKNDKDARAQAEAKYGEEIILYRDEDVLDTWFSSGLWPFSTMGWPDENAPDFRKYFPGSVLETGHDILFFWVARMIMMSYGMTGKLPFHTVYLHGLVRDEQGRKMSKSLGNVVDPLGVIGDVGCDALRFTLATGTSPGQDLNLSLERLKNNRNFTNKVWNAGKFVLFAMEELSDDERIEIQKMSETIASSDTSSLSLSERWIISKLHQTVDQVTKSLDKYDFGIAGRNAYGFFYDDFADWFIESIKTKFNNKDDPEGKKRALAVTLYACDSILRLLHPFVPYVTEEIWQALPHSGDLLISQSWPETNQKKDDAAEQSYETLRSVVTKIRNARAEYNVEPAKKIENCTIVVKDSSALLSDLQSEVAVLCSLARLDPASTTVASSAPADCEQNPSDYVNAIVADGVEVFLSLAGLADPAKESKRLKKQAEKLEKDLNGLNGRLNSEAFLSKARPDVVEKAQAEAKELSEQLAAVQARLKVMTDLLATTASK